MPGIFAVHAFRRGTGTSHLTANLAALLAAAGRRVGVVDTNFQSPGLLNLFGLTEAETPLALNDFLWERCSIAQAAYDVTGRAGLTERGTLFLVPCSSRIGDIARLLREGHSGTRLSEGLQALLTDLRLDVLLLDTQPGLTEDTLFAFALADALLVIMQLDQQEYQGTAVTLEVARRLGVARVLLVVNNVADVYDLAAVRAKVDQTYGCNVAAVLPHSADLLRLASAAIFVLRYPDAPLTAGLRQVATVLLR